ncbi:MAG: cytochrome P450 [Pseudomonadales bacterium]|nr:cytochrome P450 [Pseudomonadales bacterium]
MPVAQLPPGPTEAKFIQALKMGIGIYDYLEECHQKYGDAFTLNLSGLDPMVWVKDKEMVKDFFNLKPEQLNQSTLPIPIDIGDNSVGFITNREHMETRKIVVPPFVGKRLKDRAEAMHQIISREIDRMKPGDEYDMPRLIGSITLNIIVYTLLNEMDGERFHRYHDLMLEWIQSSTNDAMFLIGTLYGPSKYRNMLHRKYRERALEGKTASVVDKLMPWNKSIDIKVKIAHQIREDIRAIRANPDGKEGVLAGYALATWSSGELLDEEKVIGEVMSALVGGHETSAATGAWYMLWLLKKPHIYKKMRQEVLQSIEENGRFDPIAITENKYLNACLNESQRLTPSAVGTMRHLVADTKIGSLYLPADTNVLAGAYLRHRDQDTWGDDVMEYRPERWLEEDGFKPGPFDFFPFGGGRRACIGSNQAKQQLRILFAEFARRVEFDSKYAMNNKWPGQQQVSGQTEPKGGVPVTIKEVRSTNFGYPESDKKPEQPEQKVTKLATA